MSLEIIYGSIKNSIAVSQLIERISNDISGTIYFGYPILTLTDITQAVDALLLSKEYGLIMFSFESSSNSDIEEIKARQDEIAFALEAYLMKSDLLRQGRKLIIKPVVISFFPAGDRVLEYEEKEYCFAGPETVLNLIQKKNVCQPISDENFSKLSAVIQSVQNLKPNKKRRNAKLPNSKGIILKNLEKEIANLDQWQKIAAIETCEGPQRIRGLAGSGKTVVLALKAAYLHTQYPDWDIVITFNTRSLWQQFRDLVERFTYEQSREKPDWNKVHIMHAWGSTKESGSGIYSTIAQSCNVIPVDFTTAKNQYGMNDAFSGICDELLAVVKNQNKGELFDVVLIDEAQDLPISFMRLIYHTAKPPKRIVWAYDELQNLYNTSMPSVEELFGSNKDGRPLVSLHNSKNSARQDIALPVCYRNTPWALTIAHALGFGIYRREGIVQFFDTPAFWEDVGYEVISGDLGFSSKVTLQRSPESYPKYFKNKPIISPEDAIQIFSFNSEKEQYEWAAEQILQNIEKDELDPDDILVIFPNANTYKNEFTLFRESLLQRRLNSHLAGVTTSQDTFVIQGLITVSGINRAKGNEAPMVYVMNTNWCVSGIEMIKLRNILFTAITRSRAWIRICGTGTGIKILEQEFNSVVKNNYSLDFTVPSKEELQHIRRINRDRTSDEQKEIKQAGKKIKELNDLVRKGILNPDTMPELQELIKSIELANKY
ncbi:MAG: ATP-binding domain-containing protein [Planctomycetaceae bacterium]|jgi:superfamily I DNA and RNA helicase|nr:ATP-binding domain-containing protein [Planctomycetaceae bacterium]